MLPLIKKMTFFKVNDPKNRELIKEVIAKRAVIREADRRRKMGEAFEFEQLSRFFKPITKQAEKMTEKIEKGVKGLPGEIAKVLPRPINITQQMQPMQPPPAYEAPFAEETETPGEIKEIGKDLPNEVKKIDDDGYQIGEEVFKIKHENKTIQTMEESINSDKIYNILTNKKYNISWNELNDYEKTNLGKLIVDSDILYGDNKDIASIKPLGDKKKNKWNTKME